MLPSLFLTDTYAIIFIRLVIFWPFLSPVGTACSWCDVERASQCTRRSRTMNNASLFSNRHVQYESGSNERHGRRRGALWWVATRFELDRVVYRQWAKFMVQFWFVLFTLCEASARDITENLFVSWSSLLPFYRNSFLNFYHMTFNRGSFDNSMSWNAVDRQMAHHIRPTWFQLLYCRRVIHIEKN